MASTGSILRAARPLFRQAPAAGKQAFRTQFRPNTTQWQYGSGRRWQSGAGTEQQAPNWFKRMWESEVGIKTVHFWAPVMKWALVLAGIADLQRPAEKLSLTQNAALTATGIIWTRWCLIIKPKNYLLAAVNFFLGIVGIVQVSRILIHQSKSTGGPAGLAMEIKDEVKAEVEDAKVAIKA